ncbi:junctional sarcoplasmic reticulum protein 1 [Talpa occidentalis]|uniref:junctional sarcoplasmic reticulum protein 1 n=1 Tax=Talpa occidentalis TaxID=50954 RepID=UPI0023F6E67C|nr:junctional sarcoplasmic reticulum protein 1 [Talpa occidentalis]
MATRTLEDGVPGGCQARGTEAGLKKTDREPEATLARGSGKEKMKAGATPRSPARKRTQPAPPPQPPLPPGAGEELPWGDLSLNKCLVLASLLALLGWAVQLLHDVGGERPCTGPRAMGPPSSAPGEAELPQPEPRARALPAGLPEAAERAAGPGSREAAEKARGQPGGDAEEGAEPRARRGPKERRAQPGAAEQRPREEKRRREQMPRQEKPREPPEAREAPPRRREAAGGGPGPGARGSGDRRPRKRPAWASEEEDRPPGRQKRRPGRGRS